MLKSSADESVQFLRTSYFLHVMEKFKDEPERCVEIAQMAVDNVDPTDDRISLLWNKVWNRDLNATKLLTRALSRSFCCTWSWRIIPVHIPR